MIFQCSNELCRRRISKRLAHISFHYGSLKQCELRYEPGSKPKTLPFEWEYEKPTVRSHGPNTAKRDKSHRGNRHCLNGNNGKLLQLPSHLRCWEKFRIRIVLRSRFGRNIDANGMFDELLKNPPETRGIFYNFSIGAMVMLSFLIHLFAPENAISAMSSLRLTIRPSPHCGCRILSPSEKSEAECLLTLLTFGAEGAVED